MDSFSRRHSVLLEIRDGVAKVHGKSVEPAVHPALEMEAAPAIAAELAIPAPAEPVAGAIVASDENEPQAGTSRTPTA